MNDAPKDESFEQAIEKSVESALQSEFQSSMGLRKTASDLSRFVENGDRLYNKQRKALSELQLAIDTERAQLINKSRAEMIELQNQAEQDLFEFDQRSAERLANAERMLRALDALRRTR